MENIRKKTKNKLISKDIIIKKKYGQNFLVDSKVIEEITKNEKDKNIIEIGPGLGSLTFPLEKNNKKVVLIEIDKQFIEILKKEKKEKTKIINKSILKLDLSKIIKEHFDNEDTIVFSNLPYYITSKIIEKTALEFKIKRMYFMMQKELGEKFLKKEKSNYINFLTNYLFKIEKIIYVGKNSFYPVPKVDSIVLKFTRKRNVENDVLKLKKAKKLFLNKRKKIKNIISKYNNKKIGEEILNKRVEDLTDKQIYDLIEYV